MKLDDIIALARDCADTSKYQTLEHCRELARTVVALLSPEKPCIADPADIVNVDSDHYVTVYQMHSMRGDEAHWVALEILKVALAAKERTP